MLDIVMLRLRTADGLDLGDFGERLGSGAVRAVKKALDPHEQAGLVEQSSEEGKEEKSEGSRGRAVVRLTDPDGFLVSNDIISDVFSALMPDEGKQHHDDHGN